MATDLREYLAAERTMLAYVRTGIAIMGIGFVVARFNVMLRLLPAGAALPPPTGRALWFGFAMVLTGGLLAVLSGLQYRGQVRALNAQLNAQLPPSRLGLSTAYGLGVVGIIMAVYLVISTR